MLSETVTELSMLTLGKVSHLLAAGGGFLQSHEEG